MNKKQIRELDKLVANVDPKAKPPRGLAFWSDKMLLQWFIQHQKKENG